MSAAESRDLYRHVLDAMPTPIFLVDDDLFVLDYNAAAQQLLIAPARTTPGQRGGHVLSCLNAVNRTEGCGRTPHCNKCGLRKALNAARNGDRQVHTRTTLRLVRDGEPQDRVFRISVAAMPTHTEARWLLVMDDHTDQVALERLFPLCSSCRDLRRDDGLKQQAEDYLARHWEGDPEACLCPDCRARLLGPQG